MDNFITIENDVQTEIVEKKSKFIANILYVQSVNEAELKIKQIKKKYFDARHNCIAYRIMQNNSIIEKSSDDGEPSGTAGAPILNILQKNNYANILVVVTRYFGGILLGTGGLVRAYSDATFKGIEKSSKIEKCRGYQINVEIGYSNFDSFKYYCKNNRINIKKSQYLKSIECIIEAEEKDKDKLIEDFKSKKIFLENLKVISSSFITKSI